MSFWFQITTKTKLKNEPNKGKLIFLNVIDKMSDIQVDYKLETIYFSSTESKGEKNSLCVEGGSK